VSCSAICDAMMRRHGHRAHVTDLVSPAPERGLLGPAVTMQFMPLRADLLDAARHDFSALLDAAVAGRDPEGCVLVVSSWGHPDQPVAGGKKLSRLANLGLAGLVADARLRDFAEVVDLGLAAWCRGETVRQGGDVIMPWAADVPVAVGGVTVVPGDQVYADASGAVVIPADDLRPILEEAARIEERDAAEVARMRQADAARGR
jgi:regulator of RNase E activity RraA